MTPSIIPGGIHKDNRGKLSYNNSFDASVVKRMYMIENVITFIRRWQGHKIEQRWFSAVKGEFKIQLIKIDNWETPNKESKKHTFTISDNSLDVLHIPKGYITSIQSLTEDAKLLVMSDYGLEEIDDEYKFSPDYFIE